MLFAASVAVFRPGWQLSRAFCTVGWGLCRRGVGARVGPLLWPLLWRLLRGGCCCLVSPSGGHLWKFGPESLVVYHPFIFHSGLWFLEVNGLSSGALFEAGRFEAFENEACLFAGRRPWYILSFLWGVLFSEENSEVLIPSQFSLKVQGQNFYVYFFSLQSLELVLCVSCWTCKIKFCIVLATND